MANNFIPWLGDKATTSPQQANYKKIALTGFEAGGFVKAEDFNAALRMTTLVCAGIASVFGFDSLTIDNSEEIITKAIQGANITLGNITANGITVNGPVTITGSITAEGFNGGTGTVDSRVVSTETLTITEGGSIDASKNGTIQAQSITANVITGNAAITTEQLNAGSITASAGTITGLSSTTIGTSTIEVDNINAKTASKITIGTTLSATTIEGSSVTIGTGSEKTEISSSGITTNSLTAAGGTISSNNITATDTLAGKSLVINGVTRISDIGSIKAGWLTVGESSSDGVEITGDGNITASGRVLFNGFTSVQNTLNAKDINAGNIYTTDYINTKGSVRTNGVDRITSAGIMFPSKLNLKNISNCAYLASGGDVVISIGKGTTEGYEHFGAKIPELPYSGDENNKQILLACISIETTGTNTNHVFNSVYTAILTGYPNSNQGSVIFDIYSGNGTSIGDPWGQIRVSYQPYSWFSTSNPVAPSCYIAYKKNVNFKDIETSIRVDLYPIATFN